MPRKKQNEENAPTTKKELISTIITKKKRNKFLTSNQKEYYEILKSNQITICSGPAGVGKSYIAMKALSLIHI